MPSAEMQKSELENIKITKNKAEFIKMRVTFPDRVTIVSEGDSWFAYPKKWIWGTKPANLIDHISKWTWKKANFLTMASNGDEAVDMISGKQKHALVNILKWHKGGKDRKPVDLLLFSGGGNDVVGENDFERFIMPYDENYTTAEQYVNIKRLERKAKQISLAYQELLDIRDHYCPKTIVMTHTYDYPYPSLTGGVFLGGLIKTKAWMQRFMDKEGIPEEFHADIIRIFMDAMAKETLSINRKNFIVIDSRETLTGRKEWLNEIHPTSEGFEKIAKLIYKEIIKRFPKLA